MRRHRFRSLLALTTLSAVALSIVPALSYAADPEPGTPEYVARDAQNMKDAYGRIIGPGGQLQNPAYLTALTLAGTADQTSQLMEQAASPTRIAVTPGRVFPGWNVGNPLRMGWNGTRGLSQRISFTNKYGALLNGTVYRPKPGARDPYTGQVLRGPFPGVVITEGSVQGSEGMYRWLAQDLAERGYVVLTYDVQGQGGSETLPHEPVPGSESNALPFCNPFATPQDGEQYGCPGSARPAAVQLRGRHQGRPVVLHLDSLEPLRQPPLRGREGERLQPLLELLRPHP